MTRARVEIVYGYNHSYLDGSRECARVNVYTLPAGKLLVTAGHESLANARIFADGLRMGCRLEIEIDEQTEHAGERLSAKP